MIWTQERDARLKALWEKGHTAAFIAGEVGGTRNAVIGRASRLKLERRPSPVVRAVEPALPKPAVRKNRTDAAASKPVTAPPPPVRKHRSPTPAQSSLAVPPMPAANDDAPPVADRYGQANCLWIMGELKPAKQRKATDPQSWAEIPRCDGPRVPGKPYCAGHHDKARVRGAAAARALASAGWWFGRGAARGA